MHLSTRTQRGLFAGVRTGTSDHDDRLVGIVALGDFAVDSSEIQPAAEALSKISEPTRS
jgi:hypothetical protein